MIAKAILNLILIISKYKHDYEFSDKIRNKYVFYEIFQTHTDMYKINSTVLSDRYAIEVIAICKLGRATRV